MTKFIEPWFKIQAATTSKPNGNKMVEAYIYGEISSMPWTENGKSAGKFLDELAALQPFSNLILHINSPGGDPFEAQAIYTTLKSKPYSVTAIIDGLAASAATIIMCAANTVQMPSGSMIMIHNASGMCAGDNNDMAKMADNLQKVNTSMRTAYKSKTGLDDKTLTAMMDAETWMDANEAMKWGFCDQILTTQIAACMSGSKVTIGGATFDLSKFTKRPNLPQMSAQHTPTYTPQQTQPSKPRQYTQADIDMVKGAVDPIFYRACERKGWTIEKILYQATVQERMKSDVDAYLAHVKELFNGRK